MTWHLLLVPLAVLVILPPFAFIGCNFVPGDLPDPGPYAPTIEATPGLIAYWRLGEPSTTAVPSSGAPPSIRREGSTATTAFWPLRRQTPSAIRPAQPARSRWESPRGFSQIIRTIRSRARSRAYSWMGDMYRYQPTML